MRPCAQSLCGMAHSIMHNRYPYEENTVLVQHVATFMRSEHTPRGRCTSRPPALFACLLFQRGAALLVPA